MGEFREPSNMIGFLQRIWPVAQIDPSEWHSYGAQSSVYSLGPQGQGWDQVLGELSVTQLADRTFRYYYGVLKLPYGNQSGGTDGLAFFGGYCAVGTDLRDTYIDPWGMEVEMKPVRAESVLAHEVGHSWGRMHAPCGSVAGPDPNYPYPGGKIQAWGYDVFSNEHKDPSYSSDIMGYCWNQWVSDYNYRAVLAYREATGWKSSESKREPLVASNDPTPRSLVLWGRVGPEGAILEPSFHIAVNARPPEPGDHLLEGIDAAGRRLFAVTFEPLQVADKPGPPSFGFAFSIPLSQEDALRLVELRWSKTGSLLARQSPSNKAMETLRQAPGNLLDPEIRVQPLSDGTTQILWDDSVYPMVMIMDKAKGRVVGFGRAGQANLLEAPDEMEIHYSTGVSSKSLSVIRPAWQ